MKKITFLMLMIFFIGSQLTAQNEKCGFDQIMKSKANNSIFQKNKANYERYVKEFSNRVEERSGGGTITIPCVVHILHTGQAPGTQDVGGVTPNGANPNNAQIMSGIADMTNAFRGEDYYAQADQNGFYDAATDIQFVLAKTAPNGSSTNNGVDAIIRYDVSSETGFETFPEHGLQGLGGADLGTPFVTAAAGRNWPPVDYMNIWLVHEFNDNADVLLGFAGFPLSAVGQEDGLVMRADAFGREPNPDGPPTPGFILGATTNLNGTANHEVGHYLSLYHTFEGDNEGADCPTGNGCGNGMGDCCGDIPPHKRSSGCPDITNSNTCDGNDPNNYIHNFMDYSDDACFHGFSGDQKTRMEAALSGPRKTFCTSIGDDEPSDPYPSTTAIATVTGVGEGGMGIYDIILNGTTFTSLSAYHDGGYLNRVASQPTVNLNTSTNYTISVQVSVGNTDDDELAAVYIDYNDNGDFSDAGEQIAVSPPNQGKKNGAIHSFSFTTPASGAAITSRRLRMRVITDFDDGVTPISDPNAASNGGQIEDYSVKLAAPVLPVTLTFFKTRLTDKNAAQLTWKTELETNNKGFSIERSANGRDFKEIGFEYAKGSNSSSNNYTFKDEDLAKGLYFYCLKQLDLDGKFEYSNIETVRVKSKHQITAFPNPVDDFLHVNYLSATTPTLYLLNTLGQKMSVSTKQGTKQLTLNLSSLPKGVYFLHEAAEGFVSKVIKK